MVYPQNTCESGLWVILPETKQSMPQIFQWLWISWDRALNTHSKAFIFWHPKTVPLRFSTAHPVSLPFFPLPHTYFIWLTKCMAGMVGCFSLLIRTGFLYLARNIFECLVGTSPHRFTEITVHVPSNSVLGDVSLAAQDVLMGVLHESEPIQGSLLPSSTHWSHRFWVHLGFLALVHRWVAALTWTPPNTCSV